MNWRSIDELILEYKNLINFEDSMEKNNFKFVMSYLKREEKRKNLSEVKLEQFVLDVIDIHKRYLLSRKFWYG